MRNVVSIEHYRCGQSCDCPSDYCAAEFEIPMPPAGAAPVSLSGPNRRSPSLTLAQRLARWAGVFFLARR